MVNISDPSFLLAPGPLSQTVAFVLPYNEISLKKKYLERVKKWY